MQKYVAFSIFRKKITSTNFRDSVFPNDFASNKIREI